MNSNPMQFFPAFNHLRILSKLRLFLTIPLMAVVFFAGIELLDDYQRWNNAKASQRLLTISTILSSLAHELQKERGLNVKETIADSTVSFLLQQQRIKVNQYIAQYRQAILASPYYPANDFPQELERIDVALSTVASVRSKLDAGHSGERAGAFYSGVITDILELILQLQLVSENLEIAESARSYSALQWLKENAMLEQDTLFKLLTGEVFAALTYSDLNTYIAAQDAYLTKFNAIASAAYQALLRTHLNSPVIDDFMHFRRTILHKAAKSLALNELQYMIGYGGLIHHFKNYVIRGDGQFSARFQQNYDAACRAIAKYRNLPMITPEETHRLDIIESTFNRYHNHLPTIRRLRQQGYSTTEIDAQVGVDDEPALTAISELSLLTGQFDTTDWWNKAAARIALIQSTVTAVEADLQQQTNRNQLLTSGRLASHLLLTVTVFLSTLLLGKRLKRRLVDEIVGISDKMRFIAQDDAHDQILTVHGSDEISDMAAAFNHLLTELNQANQKLRQSEASYRLISSLLPQQIWTATPDGALDFINQRVLDYFGLPEQQLLIDGWQQVIHPEDLPTCLRLWTRSLKTGCDYETEFRLRHHNGAYYWHLARALPQFDEQGVIIKWFGSNTDISERKLAEDKLKLAAMVFSNAHEGIMITDSRPAIINVNPVFTEITGYNPEEVMGKNPNILSSNRQSQEFYTAMWKTIQETGHWQGEIWNRKKNGNLYAELLTISSVFDDEGKVQNYISLFSDITQFKYQQQALEHMAHFDVLTHLPNRTLFSDRFHQAIAQSKRNKTLLAVVFLDLDGFKPINDKYGHEAGDQILIEVAKRIMYAIREEDTASRLGGDEFALLLTHVVSQDQCKQILSRIYQTITYPYQLDGQTITLGVSGGVTLFPLDEGDPDTLLRHADHAMYQAKMEGKNRYHFFDSGAIQQLAHKHQQLQDIEQALEKEQFSLYYQPKVNMKSGRVFGAEALIRWQHPQQGVLLPGVFLPVIEGSKLETKVGQWVITTAIKQLDQWQRQGLKLELSINISSRHLLDCNFITQLQDILQRFPAVRPDHVQLEILESSALGDLNLVNKVIKTLMETFNVRIALDDFGTGYSSLTHLRHLPVDTVKIDQGFVRDMLDDPNDYSIIEGVISLSQALHREVIAEGVETTEHGLLLLMQGCLLAQGYGIARPMPAAELPQWLADYRCPEAWKTLANNPVTKQQAAIELLKLTDKYWLKRLQNCLQSPAHTLPHWPIMTYHMCHSGRWIKLAQAQGVYDREWLLRLDKAHKKLHQLGNTFKNHFLEGDTALAQAGIAELKKAFAEIEQILQKIDGLVKSH